MTTELIRPNQYDLFAKTMNVRDLIAEKIENRTGGNFVGPWSDTISYNDADIVIYNGCLYTSIANENLNNVPSQLSAFWNRASLLKNNRLYNVNNDIGDDSKATAPCGGPYPFRTLDAAWDRAVLENPSGGFIIFLQYGTDSTPYTFSRDIQQGINNITFIGQDSRKIIIDISNTINVYSDIFLFSNITLRGFFESTNIQPMLTFRVRRRNVFKNCTFAYFVDGVLESNEEAISIYPSTFNDGSLLFKGCDFQSNATRFIIQDTTELPSRDFLTFVSFVNSDNSIFGRPIVQDIAAVNPLTIPGQFIVNVINHDIRYQSNNIASLYFNNCRVDRDLTSSLESPGVLEFNNVQFIGFTTDNLLKRLIKNGDANYRFTDFLKSDSTTIAPSANPGSYDVTSGPKYDYRSWNTYGIDDLVVYNGSLYKCMIDDTIGVTPDYGSPNWDMSNVNLISRFGTGATLTLAAATSEQLLPVGAIAQDPYSMVSVAANIITLTKAGLYEVSIGMTSATTQIAGQNDIFNVYINKDTVTPTYASAESISELTRGLVSNSVTFPTTNKTTTLAVLAATPGESFGIYIRNTSALSYDINVRNIVIQRLN